MQIAVSRKLCNEWITWKSKHFHHSVYNVEVFQGTLLIYKGMRNTCLFNPSYYYCTSVFINSRMLMDYLRSILSERIPHGTLNEVHVGGPYQITWMKRGHFYRKRIYSSYIDWYLVHNNVIKILPNQPSVLPKGICP